MEEISHVLEVLKETREAVKKQDIYKLKDLSNQTIHSSSINQDADNIMVAVIIYSISKILERPNFREYPGWESFYQSLLVHIEHSIFALEKRDIEKFRFEIKKMRKTINKLSGNFKKHIQEVFNRAKINKASRIYEHGISMEKTARLLGISIWDLAEYAGQTGISDVNLSVTMPVKKRIKIAMEAFER